MIANMNLTYILLICTVASCFMVRKRIVTISCIVVSTLVALFQGVIDFYGLSCLALFYYLTYIYFYNSINKIVRTLLISAILLMVIGFILHIVPGFYNLLAIDNVSISPLSASFSMYLNFDKTMAGIILFLNSTLYNDEKSLDSRSLLQTILLLTYCSAFLIITGLAMGYIKFDVKIPSILGIWVINNLFFVCLAEEVIFRGIVQNHLKLVFKDKNLPYMSLVLSSLIFGLLHFKGGMVYVILASISGGFYGLAYEKTNRISSAMIVHFGLNLTHLIFFTYPAAINN